MKRALKHSPINTTTSTPARPNKWQNSLNGYNLNHLLELRLGQAGLDSRGLTAGVPHYVARDDYPAGAAALLASVAEVTGLALPLGDLEAAAAVNLGLPPNYGYPDPPPTNC